MFTYPLYKENIPQKDEEIIWNNNIGENIKYIYNHTEAFITHIRDQIPGNNTYNSVCNELNKLNKKLIYYLCENNVLKDRITELKQLLNEKDEQKKDLSVNCCVCMEEKSRNLILPCRHLCCCAECSNKINNCPICRVVIAERIEVFVV